MRRCWVLLTALAATAASGATVWRWVDETGQVHYSDRPVPGAEQIELSGAQSFPATRLQPPTAPAQPPAAQAERYRSFEVVSPSQQETLWNIGSVLNVQVEIEPPLQPGHRLDVYLDGRLRNVGATTPQFTVPEVFRGVHTMQAVILNADDEEILRTLAVTFMVQQTSIQNPNNPNAPRRQN